MKITKHILALFAILSVAFSTAAFATPEAQKPEVKAVQKGDKVTISWTLPKDDWRVIILSRNTQEKPRGRAKIKQVNPNKSTSYVDTVPDATKPYWYWLKATRTNGDPVEIGPIAITK